MRILKRNSPLEKKIRRIEALLNAEGVSLSTGQGGIIVSVAVKGEDKEYSFVILGESKVVEQVFPTQFAPTYIQTVEDFRHGR